jgi:hypothetical protein
MSTDISLQSTTYQVGNRQWLLAEPDVKLNVTLDPSKFTAGTHFPNGYLPSGTVVGIKTATGLAGPYDDAASDGRRPRTASPTATPGSSIRTAPTPRRSASPSS